MNPMNQRKKLVIHELPFSGVRHVIAALETAHDQAAENDRCEIASDLREMRLTLHWWVNVRNVEVR